MRCGDSSILSKEVSKPIVENNKKNKEQKDDQKILVNILSIILILNQKIK